MSKPFFWYYQILLTDGNGDVSSLASSDGIGRGTTPRSLAKSKALAKSHVGKHGVVKAEVIKRSSSSVAVFTAKKPKKGDRR